ncbi:MAG: hypothetical protein J6Y18_05190 [Candidatus Methanomethylophilaceae archaeon]|nr:hypothetical protein [Candidatus Methanomethylophilaceae archaeon]
MTAYDYDSIVNKIDVISQDARIVGRIQEVRYDPHDYTITGLAVRCEKEISSIIDAGNSKSRILIKPDNGFELYDVLLLSDTLENAKAYIQPDIDTMSAVRGFIGKDVITSEHLKLGVIDAVYLDLDGWFIDSFLIKVDKDAHTPLGLKKLLKAKRIRGVKADHISVMSENILLGITMEDVRGIMLPDED